MDKDALIADFLGNKRKAKAVFAFKMIYVTTIKWDKKMVPLPSGCGNIEDEIGKALSISLPYG